jgi:hypothetical protein
MYGSKLIVLTGDLYLYGNAPQTQWTKLLAFADAGDTEIVVG